MEQNGVTPALIIGKNVVPNGYQQGKQRVVVKLNNAIWQRTRRSPKSKAL